MVTKAAGPRRAANGPLSRLVAGEHGDRLVLVFASALLVRGVWAGFATPDPLDGRCDDSVFYHRVAIFLAQGDGYTNPFTTFPTAQWPPGYSFFLAGIYWLFGTSLVGARLANVVLGGA